MIIVLVSRFPINKTKCFIQCSKQLSMRCVENCLLLVKLKSLHFFSVWSFIFFFFPFYTKVSSMLQLLQYWLFSSKSSRHCLSQTVRALKLNFWENVQPPPFFTCRMSYVMCQVSRVRCHMSDVNFFFVFKFVYKVVKIVDGGSVIIRVYPV